MTREELKEIKDDLAKITPGPWEGVSCFILLPDSGGTWVSDSDEKFIIKAQERIAALVEAVEQLQKCRSFEPKSSSDVHHGEEYFVIERHVCERYSATEEVSPGTKTTGNPVIGPAKTVYVERAES